MVNNNEFFSERKPAAVVKHAVLQHYFSVFASKLGSVAPEVWFIDAFAGPGEYESEDDAPAEPGSPRILCDVAENIKNTRVRGVFIEPNSQYFDQLRLLVTQSATGRQHVVHNGTASTHLLEAVQKTGSSPLLIFLDPFGVGIPLDDLVAALKARPLGAVTEILLNFNVESLWRIGGYLSSADSKLRSSKALQQVDAFVGGDWWRSRFIQTRGAEDRGSASAAAQAIAAEYQSLLKARLGFDALHVPVRRSRSGTPIFLLTLFFKSGQAAWVFADAASSSNRRLRSFYKNRSDSELPQDGLLPFEMLQEISDSQFEAEEKKHETLWVSAIATNIAALLSGTSQIALADHVLKIYGDTLGFAGEKHVRRAWDTLASQGEVLPRDKRLRSLSKAVITRA